MKKTISCILILTVLLSICSFFSITIFSAKAEDNKKSIYEEANTYNVLGNIVRNDPSNTGDGKKYKYNQYKITYDMTNKNTQQVANSASVTVFTHGYTCDASVWSNTGESAQKKEDFKFAYDSTSIVQRVASLYGNNYELLWAKMKGYEDFDLTVLTDKKLNNGIPEIMYIMKI